MRTTILDEGAPFSCDAFCSRWNLPNQTVSKSLRNSCLPRYAPWQRMHSTRMLGSVTS
jgi:hypothetical protein